MCAEIDRKFPYLDIIVNNACQTVRRPPKFYEHLIHSERQDVSDVSLRSLLSFNFEYQWKMKGNKHLQWTKESDGNGENEEEKKEERKEEREEGEGKNDVGNEKIEDEKNEESKKRKVRFETKSKGVVIEEVKEKSESLKGRPFSPTTHIHGTVEEVHEEENDSNEKKNEREDDKNESASLREEDPFTEYEESNAFDSPSSSHRIKHTSSVSAEMSQIQILPDDVSTKVFTLIFFRFPYLVLMMILVR